MGSPCLQERKNVKQTLEDKIANRPKVFFTPARRERVEVDAVVFAQELGGTTSALQTAQPGTNAHDALLRERASSSGRNGF